MENFGKDQNAYKKFKEAMLQPVSFQEQRKSATEKKDLFDNMPSEEKLNYFSLNASILSHTATEISVLIEMAKEKGIDIRSEMETIGKEFHDFYALGAGERSFSEMSRVGMGLFWKLRTKVANDEKSFSEVLERTKQREAAQLKERDDFLDGYEGD